MIGKSRSDEDGDAHGRGRHVRGADSQMILVLYLQSPPGPFLYCLRSTKIFRNLPIVISIHMQGIEKMGVNAMDFYFRFLSFLALFRPAQITNELIRQKSSWKSANSER